MISAPYSKFFSPSCIFPFHSKIQYTKKAFPPKSCPPTETLLSFSKILPHFARIVNKKRTDKSIKSQKLFPLFFVSSTRSEQVRRFSEKMMGACGRGGAAARGGRFFEKKLRKKLFFRLLFEV